MASTDATATSALAAKEQQIVSLKKQVRMGHEGGKGHHYQAFTQKHAKPNPSNTKYSKPKYTQPSAYIAALHAISLRSSQLADAKSRPRALPTPISTSNASTARALVEGGLSVTDVYNAMMTANEELEEERKKNADHERALERINAELMLKIPMMERQKREHEEANERIIDMAKR